MPPCGFEKTLIDTIVMLCKNSMIHEVELKVQGLLGITVDDEVFLIQIDERFREDSSSMTVMSERMKDEVSMPTSRHGQATFIGQRRRVQMQPSGMNRPYRARAAPVGGRTKTNFAYPGNRHSLVSQRSSQPQRRFMSPRILASQGGVRHPTPKQEALSSASGQTSTVKEEFVDYSASNVICVESDEELFEHPTDMRSEHCAPPKGKMAVQGIVENAINEARSIHQQATFVMSLPLNEMDYEDIKPGCDIQDQKPATFTTPALNAAKVSSPRARPGSIPTASHVRGGYSDACKTETDSSQYGWSAASPPAANAIPSAGDNSCNTWTSVTSTTFVCTTGGCDKKFTTKRAMVRHQKEKHREDGTGVLYDPYCD